MTFGMSPPRNKLSGFLNIASGSKSKPIDASNVGRKLLEKMGWESGLGLGKDNQGMTENLLWKYQRDNLHRPGFRSKSEMVENEILPHQNAFEDLLGELNSQAGEESINTNDSLQIKARQIVQKSRKCIRYKKISRAKDISNYSVKDFHGIIGKEVTKKNLHLLYENGNSNGPSNLKENNDVNVSLICESSSEQFITDKNSYNLQKRNNEVCVSQKQEITLVESSTCASDVQYKCREFEESENPKKKKKHHSKSSSFYEPSALKNCSAKTVARTVADCIENGSKESVPNEDNVCSTKMSLKKKSRKKIKENSENSSIFNPGNSTGQSTEINEKKKTKMKENSENSNTCNTDNSTLRCYPDRDVKPTSLEKFMGNTKSLSEIRRKETAVNEVQHVSRNAVTRFDISVGTSDKSCDLNEIETETEGNRLSNSCIASSDGVKNGDSNSPMLVSKINDFFLTDEERKKIKEHLTENPEILQHVADAFIGSNLIYIKGYGNW